MSITVNNKGTDQIKGNTKQCIMVSYSSVFFCFTIHIINVFTYIFVCLFTFLIFLHTHIIYIYTVCTV